MPLHHAILNLLGRASRALGLETVDTFPPGHRHAATRWDKAWFDVPSDYTPERIEQSMAEAIANTPGVFAAIEHPTPRMQRAMLGVIHARLRRGGSPPNDLLAMLIEAYASPRTQEGLPGLRAAIAGTEGYDPSMRVAHLAAWLADMPAAFDIIDAE